jgi:hypothetical protein
MDVTPQEREWIDAEIADKMRAIFTISDTIPYAFTISLRRFQAPELLVLGPLEQEPPTVRPMLHRISQLVPRGLAGNGLLLKLKPELLPVKLVAISYEHAVKSFPMIGKIETYHGSPPPVLLQVMIPTAPGIYPGHEDYGFPIPALRTA